MQNGHNRSASATEVFPTNRDATDRLFGEVVNRRKSEIDSNLQISQSLYAFQRYGNNLGRMRKNHRGFFSGVLTALTCVAVVVLVYHWSSGGGEQQEMLSSKAVPLWTAEEVLSWLEQLGPWARPYRETFQQEKVNGRLLVILGEEELNKHPYSIENQAHRQALLVELDRLKTLGVKPPQNLWEYKAANAGKSLFLVYALKRSPRLTIFYLYLFDYTKTFLPLLHTCCPSAQNNDPLLNNRFLNMQLQPSRGQWVEFLVKYCLVPYQLIAEFAWDWLTIHYWTSCFIIVNAMLLSVLEVFAMWKLWRRTTIRSIPLMMWNYWWKVLSQVLAFSLLWPLVPQFVYNCFFYWALYFSPVINIDRMIRQVMLFDRQAR
ncbi:bifunctional apoptosis regulator-like isoform X2 [Gouania willdenowi]|uniref:bifunctional apoptosis regulator-like isoform X2 n=1 Tax=Gouania willdenowi TaxID=441366 RepID=UPI001055DC59|nr:bifunctional apoptosis regulator isoform X2 [Gouania willdenowi]